MKVKQGVPSEDVQWALQTKLGREVQQAATTAEKALGGYEGIALEKLPAPVKAKVQELRIQLDRLTRLTSQELSEAVIGKVVGERTLAALKMDTTDGAKLDPSDSVFRNYRGAMETWLALEKTIRGEAKKLVDEKRKGRYDGHGYSEDMSEAQAKLRAETPGYAEARKQVVASTATLARSIYTADEVREQKLGLLDRSAQSLHAQARDIIALLEASCRKIHHYGDSLEISYVPKKLDEMSFDYHHPESTLTKEGVAVLVDQIAYLARIRVAMMAQHRNDPLTKEIDAYCQKYTFKINEGRYRTQQGDFTDGWLNMADPGRGIMKLAENGFYPKDLAQLVADEFARGANAGVSTEEKPLAGSKPV